VRSLAHGPPELPRIIPGALRPFVNCGEGLLAKRPAERPEHAAEVSVLLRAVGRGFAGFSQPLFVRPARQEAAEE
jgi:hypothetical protein